MEIVFFVMEAVIAAVFFAVAGVEPVFFTTGHLDSPPFKKVAIQYKFLDSIICYILFFS